MILQNQFSLPTIKAVWDWVYSVVGIETFSWLRAMKGHGSLVSGTLSRELTGMAQPPQLAGAKSYPIMSQSEVGQRTWFKNGTTVGGTP